MILRTTIALLSVASSIVLSAHCLLSDGCSAPCFALRRSSSIALDQGGPEASLLLRTAIEQYRSGHYAQAVEIASKIDRSTHRNILERLDPADLPALGALEIELGMRAEKRDDGDGFAFPAQLAKRVSAAASRLRSSVDSNRPVAIGLLYVLLRDLGQTGNYLSAATRRSPKDIELWLLYGGLLETEATGQDAFSLSGAPLSGPRSGGLLRDDVLSRARMVREAALERAAGVFKHVLTLDSRSAEARTRLARILALEGDDTQAAALLEATLSASLARDWEYIAALVLGDLRERSGQPAVARQLYERALSVYPHGQTAWLALSHLLSEQGDAPAAGQALDRVFAEPNDDTTEDPWWGYPTGRRSADRRILNRLRGLVAH